MSIWIKFNQSPTSNDREMVQEGPIIVWLRNKQEVEDVDIQKDSSLDIIEGVTGNIRCEDVGINEAPDWPVYSTVQFLLFILP